MVVRDSRGKQRMITYSGRKSTAGHAWCTSEVKIFIWNVGRSAFESCCVYVVDLNGEYNPTV